MRATRCAPGGLSELFRPFFTFRCKEKSGGQDRESWEPFRSIGRRVDRATVRAGVRDSDERSSPHGVCDLVWGRARPHKARFED